VTVIGVNAIWEYQEVTNETPADPGALTVPAAGWTAGGVAPFGTGDPPAGGAAAIETAWTPATALWIRRNVVLNGLEQLVLRGRVENACYVFFDGSYVGAYNPSNAQLVSTPEWVIAIPGSLGTAGTHEVALLCTDEEGAENPGSNVYISVEGDYAPALIPFQPRAPVQETLSWLTDVQTAKDGSETRSQRRIKARQMLKFIYPVQGDDMRRAFNMAYGRKSSQWSIPVWTQAQHIGAVASGLFTITAEPDYSDFREGEYALLWQSPTQHQLLVVADLGGSSITFYNLTDEYTDAWIMPVRQGFLPGNVNKRLTGYRAEHEMTFQVEDNIALSVSAPTQFLSEDIYYDETLMSGNDTTDDIIGQLDLQDEELGIVAYYAPWLHSKVARSHRQIAEGPAEAWALRQWLYRRAGRYRGFWQPSFEADLHWLNTSTITTTLDVKPDDYQAYATDRTHIAVETTSGWLPRTITNVEAISDTVLRLTLDTSLATDPADIKRICWLGFKRLNTDNVELSWPGAGLCEMEVRLLEIDP
jgi:hypothetical protein